MHSSISDKALWKTDNETGKLAGRGCFSLCTARIVVHTLHTCEADHDFATIFFSVRSLPWGHHGRLGCGCSEGGRLVDERHSKSYCFCNKIGVCPKAASGCAAPVYNAARIKAQISWATYCIVSESMERRARRATAVGSGNPAADGSLSFLSFAKQGQHFLA